MAYNIVASGTTANLINLEELKALVNGNLHKLAYINSNALKSNIQLPTAPNIYPYNTVLTAEQIASGVIKHADSSNSGLIVNGKFDVDTSGWATMIDTSNLSIDAGRIKATSTVASGYMDFNQAFATVAGKKYIVNCSMDKGNSYDITAYIRTGAAYGTLIVTSTQNTFEFTATTTTTNIAFRTYFTGIGQYSFVDNVAVYPADAISRSDLVFLESWHEDISEKNFVYPLGNVQYLGGNKDGVTGIANGAFTGFETYSLFGNWQTPSSLIGKGYVWSSLTEAQKKAVIANPENNCYLDGDKTIQVRYRVRVVQGLGDNWDYPFNNMLDGGGSDPFGATVSYAHAGIGNKYLKPKGKRVSIVADVSAYNANETGLFANKNYKNITTGYEIGMATAISNDNTTLDTNVAYEGKCYAIPIALVQR